MKTVFLKIMGLVAMVCCFAIQSAIAQPKPATTRTTVKPAATTVKPTKISDADQQAIIKLFEGVDPSLYRLEFNNKQKVAGKRAVQMQDLQQVRRVTNPAEAAGYIVFVVEGDNVVYVLAVGSSKLESVLGRQKTAQLNAIMAKYSR